MERGIDNSKRSIFDYIKNSKSSSYIKLSSMKIIDVHDQNEGNSDFRILQKNVQLLQAQVLLPKNNITNIISSLEFAIAPGNNDEYFQSRFYTSKLFIDIINCFDTALPIYQEKILSLIDRCLHNKSVSKYLAKNTKLLSIVLPYLSNNTMYETSIKICESLLMSSPTLVSFDLVNNQLNITYKYMHEKNRLDSFCRLLVIFIFDYTKYEFKQIFLSKERLKIKTLTKTTAENQVYCLHYDNFLENIMVTLRNRIEQTKRIANEEMTTNQIFFLLRSQSNLRSNPNQQKEYKPKISKVLEEGIGLNVQGKGSKGNNINKIGQTELILLLHLNVFTLFEPKFVQQNNRNIYNTYHQIGKLLKKIDDETKIHKEKKEYVTLMKYRTYQIEILFVLSTFLGSKRKIEMQNKLSSLDIIDLLWSYFDYIDWGNIFGENKRPFFVDDDVNHRDENAYHGHGCCCDSDSALKIQFLRIIYSFCCRDSNNFLNKLKLLSDNDLLVFFQNGYMKLIQINMNDNFNQNINKKAIKYKKNFHSLTKKLEYIITNDSNYNKSNNKCSEDILLNMISTKDIRKLIRRLYENSDGGLLNKLILKYIQECYYSSAKFWLASCIEVILRGNNTFYQTYIATSGIIPCILYDILYSKEDQSQVVQLSFDMLGEIIKFNKGNFFIVEYYLSDSKEYNEFGRKAVSKESLVDSNVFIRSIILSKYYFDQSDIKNNFSIENFFSNKCKLFSFIKEKIHYIFMTLISIVHPNDINQTNISCINSALIILIIQYLTGTLSEFLKELRKRYKVDIKKHFDNFQILLKMWKQFYNYRTKDSASLQHSTTLPFNTWHQVIHMLLSEDANSPTSLNNNDYY